MMRSRTSAGRDKNGWWPASSSTTMDLDATGDTTRTHRAFADFLSAIDGA